jgi:[ribosomal protein S18]-alanine N-acetyltransferase
VLPPTPSKEIIPLRFRPMNLEDVARVHEIDIQSFSLPWPEKSFIFELTENPSSLSMVAEVVVTELLFSVVGMSVVWIMADEAHIATIAIDPEFRGLGYGRSLLAETLRQSTRRGAQMATLEVRESNLIAQRLYRSFGFNIVGRRTHYYHDNNEDAIIMTVAPLGIEYFAWLNQQVT